ncbi:MAG TPA: hypothetical protein VK866_00440, partial [Acidimicrobiales bacterium]|nr:hypothetical protein [Acidimicrobiales bacterium]
EAGGDPSGADSNVEVLASISDPTLFDQTPGSGSVEVVDDLVALWDEVDLPGAPPELPPGELAVVVRSAGTSVGLGQVVPVRWRIDDGVVIVEASRSVDGRNCVYADALDAYVVVGRLVDASVEVPVVAELETTNVPDEPCE